MDHKNPIIVSIIIPVYNKLEGLQITLKSITQTLGGRNDFEIIICNDGGGSAISNIAASYDVREVKLSKNRGSYAARNAGVKISTGETLVFLDADQKISKQWLDEGLRSLRDFDYVGGRIKIEIGANPTYWELLDQMTAFPTKSYLQYMHFAPTANLFVPIRVFKKVGGFNEILRSAGDRDFGVRVFKAGYKQSYNPEAITFHPVRDKAEQLRKQKRIGEGVADLHCLVWGKNPLIFLFSSLRKFFQVFIEMIYCFLRYFLVDYFKKEKLSLRLIGIKKIRKSIFYWNVVLRTIELMRIKNYKTK